MNTTPFASLVPRLVRPATRRTSILAIGSAGLAAASGLATGEAKKRKNKNQNKKAKQRCASQVAVCQELLTAACEQLPDCVVADFLPCCDPLATCQAGEAITCTTSYIRTHR
jgi:hypothetical protein